MELEKNSILYLRLGTPYSSSASFYTLYTDFNLSWKKKKKPSFITIRSDIIYHEINCKKGKERRVKSFVAHWEEGNKEGDPFSRSIHGLRTVVSSASFPVCRGKKKKTRSVSRRNVIPRWGGNKKKKKEKRKTSVSSNFPGRLSRVGKMSWWSAQERGRSSPPMFTKGTVEERLNRNPVYR